MKCEGETRREAGMRSEGVAWLWAESFSYHVHFVSLPSRAEAGGVLRWGDQVEFVSI